MADILIRGAQMPKSCKDCPVFEQTLAFPDYIKRCRLGADLPQPWPLQYEKRGDNCPLVELPPHGDLIDRAPLVRTFYERADHEGWAYLDNEDLDDAPVIVPASEEGR